MSPLTTPTPAVFDSLKARLGYEQLQVLEEQLLLPQVCTPRPARHSHLPLILAENRQAMSWGKSHTQCYQGTCAHTHTHIAHTHTQRHTSHSGTQGYTPGFHGNPSDGSLPPPPQHPA